MRFRWLPRGRRFTFLRGLTWGWRLQILGAIFCTFGTLGFVLDIWGVSELQPWTYVFAQVAYAGLTAVGYAAGFGSYRIVVPVVVAFQIAMPRYVLPLLASSLYGAAHPAPAAAIATRLHADGFGTLACIIAGYTLFIRFIGGEGARHLRVTTEIGLAQQIHSALVPPVVRTTERFELYGRSEPSSEVGGDLLDVVERPGALVVSVADVAGHGVPAGSIMGMVKSAIRMRLLTSDALDAMLDDLNTVIAQLQSPKTFVTFAALRFDGSNAAEAGLAGHLPILHCRRATGAIEAVDNACPPLGVVAGQRHTTRRVAFDPGDLFVILTDGLTEVDDRAHHQLGLAGITAVLARQVRQPLPAIYDALLAAARAHGPQTDDQTLLLVRIR